MIKIRKWTLVEYFAQICRPDSSFTVGSNNDLYRGRITSCIQVSCLFRCQDHFFSLSSSFHDLDFFLKYGLVILQAVPQFGSVWCFLIRFRLSTFCRNTALWCCGLLSASYQEALVLIEQSALFPVIWNDTCTVFYVLIFAWGCLQTSYASELISLPNSVPGVLLFNYCTFKLWSVCFLVFSSLCNSWDWDSSNYTSNCSLLVCREAIDLGISCIWLFCWILFCSNSFSFDFSDILCSHTCKEWQLSLLANTTCFIFLVFLYWDLQNNLK